MARIFLSYDRKDLAKAKSIALALALETASHSAGANGSGREQCPQWGGSIHKQTVC